MQRELREHPMDYDTNALIVPPDTKAYNEAMTHIDEHTIKDDFGARFLYYKMHNMDVEKMFAAEAAAKKQPENTESKV